MAKFIVTFAVDTDDDNLDPETLAVYLKNADDIDNPTADELHDALRAWIDEDISEVLGGEHFTIITGEEK